MTPLTSALLSLLLAADPGPVPPGSAPSPAAAASSSEAAGAIPANPPVVDLWPAPLLASVGSGDVIHLDTAELRTLPGTWGGEPFRAALTLPGMATLASGVGYGGFRGMDPATTGVYLDGVRVPQLYHLIAGWETINPDFIGALDVYRNDAPARLRGHRLGAVIDATPIPARTDGVHGTAAVDLVNLGGVLQAPLSAKGASVTLAARLGWTPLLASAVLSKPAPGFSVTALTADYQARLVEPVGPGVLRLLGFGSADLVDVGGSGIMGGIVAAANVMSHVLDLRYRVPIAGGEGEAGLTWGIDRLGAQGGASVAQLGALLTEDSWAARASWTRALSEALRLEVGADLDHRAAGFAQGVSLQHPGATGTSAGALAVPTSTFTTTGAYAQLDWRPTAALAATAVLRVADHHLVPGTDLLSVEPSLSARYAVSEAVAVRASVARVQQAPTMLVPVLGAEGYGLRSGLQDALRLDVGADWRSGEYGVSVDAYYDPLLRMVEANPFAADFLPAGGAIVRRSSESTGHAYGAEVLVRKHLGGPWHGWLSYSFQQSTRDREYEGETVQNVPVTLNQVHVVSAVSTVELPAGFAVGLGLQLHSGGANDGGALGASPLEPGVDGEGGPLWVPADPRTVERLPAFFRADVRVSKRWLGASGRSYELYLDVTNATLSRETLGYNYGYGYKYDPTTGASETKLEKSSFTLPPLIVPMLGFKATL